MPQQMQTNSTTNANKCHNKYTHATTNASKCRALRQKMHQTYVKLNVVTYVCFYIYWGPDPSRVVLLDQVNVWCIYVGNCCYTWAIMSLW